MFQRFEDQKLSEVNNYTKKKYDYFEFISYSPLYNHIVQNYDYFMKYKYNTHVSSLSTS